jgi:hypothetical protein
MADQCRPLHRAGADDARRPWRSISGSLGHWVLRGYGAWSVERKSDGVCSRAGVINPEAGPDSKSAGRSANPIGAMAMQPKPQRPLALRF